MRAFRSPWSRSGADALARGLDVVAKNYKTSVSRGSLKADEMDRRMALFNGVTDVRRWPTPTS